MAAAVRSGNDGILRCLLQAGWDWRLAMPYRRSGHDACRHNTSGEILLEWALMGRWGNVVNTLMEAGVSPNMQWNWECRQGYPFEGDVTPLNVAVLFNDIDLVRTLLKHGANPNDMSLHVVGYRTRMPLKTGKTTMARTLLKAGADPNLTNVAGDTVFMAWLKGFDKVWAEDDEPFDLANMMAVLAEYGADFAHRNNDGELPWHDLVKKTNVRIGFANWRNVLLALLPYSPLDDLPPTIPVRNDEWKTLVNQERMRRITVEQTVLHTKAQYQEGVSSSTPRL